MAVPKDSEGCAEMKLVENILRFEKHFANAKKLVDKNVSDYYVYNTLAMECFQAVNALIEVGEHIVTEKKLGFPSTYREIFEILKNEGIISGEVFNSAKRLIFLRNLIAHEYYRIREEELLEMVELLESANNLIQKVKKTEL